MDIKEIIKDQTNLLISYVDQVRSHFDILENHTIKIDKIYYDNDIYTVIYEIRPSQYLYAYIGQSLDQFKEIVLKLFDNENISIFGIDINIYNEKMVIKVQFKLKQIIILPNEQLMDVLIDLPYKDIKNYCSTSTEANQVCESNYFWKKKLRKEYPNLDIDYEEGKMEGYYEIQQFINYYKNTNQSIKEILNLKVLNLHNNEIKEIPYSIGNLTNLEELYLSNNEIEKIPDSIGLLINIEELYLSNNKIEEIPDAIGNLTNLQYLLLDNNKIEVIPDSIGRLTNLQYLNLDNNKIEVIPDSIGNFTNLQYLGLGGNKIKEISWSRR